MSSLMQDKYNLEESNSKVMQNIKTGINLSVQLNLNSNNITGLKIYGLIVDENKIPIVNATIKIMSSDYHPLFHTKTDSLGKYSFNNLPNDKSYVVFAVAKGYKLQQNNVSSFLGKENLNLNFTLIEDEELKLGVIFGTVTNISTNNPVKNMIVKLVNLNTVEILKGITYTNSKGEFMFSDIKKGNYLINLSGIGYNTLNLKSNIINDGQIVSLTPGVTENSNVKKGIISGYISNCKNNEFIEGADVILYEVKSDNSLNPIAFTKTLANGFYMFGNVPKGNYKIKSNELQEVTVNFPSNLSSSPNFYSFNISNNDGSFSNTYYAKDVSLYGISNMDSGGFIENIGSLLGYLIFKSSTIPSKGNYNLTITYVTTDSNKSCYIDVNNTTTGILYAFDPTDSLYLSSAKQKIIPLNLVQGENVIKIYNQ